MNKKLISKCCGCDVEENSKITNELGYYCINCRKSCEVIPQPIQKEEEVCKICGGTGSYKIPVSNPNGIPYGRIENTISVPCECKIRRMNTPTPSLQKEEDKIDIEREDAYLEGFGDGLNAKTPTPSDTFIDRIAMNIVYQLDDDAKLSVEFRQANNDRRIDFVKGLLKSPLQEQAKEIKWRDSLIYDLKEIIKRKGDQRQSILEEIEKKVEFEGYEEGKTEGEQMLSVEDIKQLLK